MEINTYELVYIITNIFGTYIVYKFMNIFFNREEVNKIVELLSYCAYFIFVTIEYLLMGIPIITITLNIICIMAISMNYKADMKKRLLSVALIYIILFGIETFVAVIFGNSNVSIFSTNNYSPIFMLIVIKIISYVVALILNNYKNLKKGQNITISYWIGIALIPICSLYIIIILMQARGISTNQLVFGIAAILLIDFLAFYLYDALSASMEDKIEKVLFARQNKYYENQLALMESSMTMTDNIRHDLKNHLTVIHNLVENDQKDKSLDHINQMVDVYSEYKNYANSGNINIDSILNFKIQEAKQRDITISFNLTIPSNLSISSYDMAIVLGNLLDNAMEATFPLKYDNKYIDIQIRYDKGRLIIIVENPYQGKVKQKGQVFLTTKKDDKNKHGIGLNNVKRVAEKYDGFLEISHGNQIFSVIVMMYVK